MGWDCEVDAEAEAKEAEAEGGQRAFVYWFVYPFSHADLWNNATDHDDAAAVRKWISETFRRQRFGF